MYRSIEPVKVQETGFSILQKEYSREHIDWVLDFLRKKTNEDGKIDPEALLKIKPELVPILIHLLPISLFLKLYQDHFFLANYMTKELFQFMVNRSDKLYKLKYYAGDPKSDFCEELILLNNQINKFYNFTERYFQRKINEIKDKLKFINWDDYYLGSDIILSIAQKKPVKQITLYSKNSKKQLPEIPNLQWFRKGDQYSGNIIGQYNEFIIILNRLWFNDWVKILFETDMMVMNSEGQIYCTFETYQKLGNPIPITEQKIPDDYIKPQYNTVGLRKFKYDHHTNIKNYHNCYVCKKPHLLDLVYERYQHMCLQCARFNYQQRQVTADLKSCTVLITGARHKIGLQTSLKLLRAGAKVIATTRFPNHATYNYTQCPDYDQWKSNLTICQCDYTNLGQVQALIKLAIESKVNIFINNACQTIRSSSLYYKRIQKLESIIKENSSHSIENYSQSQKLLLTDVSQPNELSQLTSSQESRLTVYKTLSFSQNDLSTIKQKMEEEKMSFNMFHDLPDPDTFEVSSWTKELSQIDSQEIMEVTIINQTVPMLIINSLKRHMPHPRFIIQVDAVEGKFNTRSKLSTHPHTNMCKAAMNMLIRTISLEKDENQYIFSVDPGYVSSVSPVDQSYPLSAEDGASRVLAPIFKVYNGKKFNPTIVHFKDYHESRW